MAQHGYVVFALDNRGSPRRGRKFSDAIFKQLGKPEVADQLTGVAWLEAQPWVDGRAHRRVRLELRRLQTLMLLAKASDQIAAGVAVAPVTDWTLVRHPLHRTLSRHAAAQPAGLRAVRRAALARRIEVDTLLLVHGMADDNVLFSNSTKLMAALQQRGTQFRLMTYPGAKHGLSTPAHEKARLHADRELFRREAEAGGE